jgi:hypothetical protein
LGVERIVRVDRVFVVNTWASLVDMMFVGRLVGYSAYGEPSLNGVATVSMVLYQKVDIDESDDNQRVLKHRGPGEESSP